MDMKKCILPLCLCLMACFSACFDDDSTVATEAKRPHEIKVEGLPQKDTSVVAFSTTLELTPTVQGYSDDELAFHWYIYGGQFGEKSEYRKNVIGEEKKLSYPVELKIGRYSVICEATHKATGYFGLVEFSLNVTSAYSDGFYALKETADGNSDLDFYNYQEKETMNDLLQRKYGAPLSGKPRGMNAVYRKVHIDQTTLLSTYATGLFVAHGKNDFALYNTVDMSLMFDRSSLYFSTMEEDEIPYAMATGENNYYFSNKGITFEGLGGGFFSSEYATGKLAAAEGAGGSSIVQAFNGRELSYWSESERCLMRTDGYPIEYKDGYTGIQIPFEQATAIASGWNWNAGENTIWYLFDVENDGRYLALLQKGAIIEVRHLDNTLSLAQAEIIAGQGLQGSFIYSIKDNQLYRYSMIEQGETALNMPSLPAGSVAYMANLFYESNFDYLVVGVQNGNAYSVAMYKIEGGRLTEAPKHTFTGTGTLKKICYAIPMDSDMPNFYAFIYDWAAPTFPY